MTSLKENAQVYMILSSLEIETKVSICDLPVAREFPEVFPKDIFGLPPEREIEFPYTRTGYKRMVCIEI